MIAKGALTNLWQLGLYGTNKPQHSPHRYFLKAAHLVGDRVQTLLFVSSVLKILPILNSIRWIKHKASAQRSVVTGLTIHDAHIALPQFFFVGLAVRGGPWSL